MKAFEVSINGRHLATAGIGHALGVLHSIVELDRGVPGYFLQGWDGQTDECLAWSAPRIELGDRIAVKIIETDQILATPFRWSTKRQRGEAFDGARYVSLRKKYEDAAACLAEHHLHDLAERVTAMKAFEVFHNNQHRLTAGIAREAGILHWIVELHCTILNHIVKGFDCRTKEYVDWSAPLVRVGDEVTVKIIETDQMATQPSRRFPGSGVTGNVAGDRNKA